MWLLPAESKMQFRPVVGATIQHFKRGVGNKVVYTVHTGLVLQVNPTITIIVDAVIADLLSLEMQALKVDENEKSNSDQDRYKSHKMED